MNLHSQFSSFLLKLCSHVEQVCHLLMDLVLTMSQPLHILPLTTAPSTPPLLLSSNTSFVYSFSFFKPLCYYHLLEEAPRGSQV